jgi:DNA-binding transcriptional MerR regulator
MVSNREVVYYNRGNQTVHQDIEAMGSYRNKDVQTLFNISPDTVRVWSEEFGEYLSPLAKPGTGKHRIFNDDDLSVFALVAEVKSKGLTYNEAHASLKSGQRGDIPEMIEERGIELRANLQLQLLQQQNQQLELERNEAVRLVKELQSDVANLQGQLERADQNSERTRTELEQARSRIEELVRQITRLEIKMEMLQEQNKD